jgi:hypothetical protein
MTRQESVDAILSLLTAGGWLPRSHDGA